MKWLSRNRTGRPIRLSGQLRPPSLTTSVRAPWTLFGPYAPDRQGPPRTGPSRQINNLGGAGPSRTASNQLEVLAGAISWGFKSPSPHQILKDLPITSRTLFS
jgi:hypothetical protein